MDIFYWMWENLPFRQFVNPEKRVYWPYLALCLVYALIFILFSKNKFKTIRFSSWLSPSARVDYAIWAINSVLQVSILPLSFANGLLFAGKFNRFLVATFGYFDQNLFSPFWGLVLYSVAFVIISDFSRFGLHYLLHHNHFLSRVHKMHHSADVLTPITLFRSHPFEMLLGQIRYLVVYTLITGLFLYFANDYYEFPKILGVSFFIFVSNILGANLRHSNIPIGFGFLERFLISPKQHQMHHSKDYEMQNSNLGSFFSIWDILFSTWKPSKGIKKLEFGIKGQEKQSLWQELIYPFQKWRQDLSFRKN